MESAKLPYVGIDIAKASFEVAVRMDSPGTQRRSVSVEQWSATATNDESGIASTVERLQGLRPALIVLEATGGFEKDVRCRFLPRHVLVGHNGGKKVADTEMPQHDFDDALGAAGGHGHRELACVLAGDPHDHLDGRHVRQQVEIPGLLFPGERQRIE